MEGVYSEYFSSEAYTESMNPNDTFDMCSKRPQDEKKLCTTLSIFSFLSNDSVQEEEVFNWCKGAGERTGNCIVGAANYLAENNITDLEKVEAMCENVEPDMLPLCIEGLSRGVAGYYGDHTEAKTVCNSVLKENNRQFCPDVLK